MTWRADVTVRDEGTLYLFTPVTESGREWIEDNVCDAELWCGALVVEHRYAADIAQGMSDDGLLLGDEYD